MKASILVVDDEPQICRALREGLEAEGYAVDTAESGEAALAGLEHLKITYREALRERYLWHEFGDLHLILP